MKDERKGKAFFLYSSIAGLLPCYAPLNLLAHPLRFSSVFYFLKITRRRRRERERERERERRSSWRAMAALQREREREREREMECGGDDDILQFYSFN